jgi:predicted transcriptional regulator
VIRNAWGLAPESSAVIILNRAGKVVFFKDGQLSQAEIDRAVQLIKQNL